MQQLSEADVRRYMRQELSCQDVRRYMSVWIKQELMPAIERACMEWLDNDVMPHVHWEALKMGFQSDLMYKVKRPRQPDHAPPPHLLEQALKKRRSGMDSGSNMASGSGSGSAGGHGSCSGMTVEPESHMGTKKQRHLPLSAKAPSKIIAPEPMGEPKTFKPPEPMGDAQDVKPFEPLRHTAMDCKEEEEDKEDDADKVAEQNVDRAEQLRQEEADKVREAEEEEEDREEEEDKTMDKDGHEGNGDQMGNDDQEPEHGELEFTSEEQERVQAEVECYTLARKDIRDCLTRRIKMVYPPSFSSRSDADGLE